MATYHLTADELLLIYITLLARDEEHGAEYFDTWFRNGGNEVLRSLFDSLQRKGLILKSYNPTIYNPNEIEFNKNFIKGWFKSGCTMGEELFTKYPSWLNINGKLTSLKNIATRFASLDDFFCFYATQINNDPEKHKEVMEILDWAKDNNKISFGILNFVISKQWEALKELRDNPEAIGTATTFDVYESV